MPDEKQYYYSEVFHSFQGEGLKTGRPTLWVRFFTCNLQCNGFGQEDPTNPDTYVLPYEDLDVSKYTKMSDLPVFEYGCDSSYSWARKFRGLQHRGTPSDIGRHLVDVSYNDINSKQDIVDMVAANDLCFTGGEPLMKHAQEASLGLVDWFFYENLALFPSVTYETNGTQILSENFIKKWSIHQKRGTELFFSVSPKLFSTSGERPEKALPIYPVQDYYSLSHNGQLKFVVNGTQESWDEMEDAIARFRQAGVKYPVSVMAAGATKEQQESDHIALIANEAIKRGYHFSARVHTYVYGNKIGT